jgi:predicted enzyme related to lactoylglutathione lyase
MLKTLNMVELKVRDWPGALRWYTEKLGLEARGLHEDQFCLLAFPEGDTTIGLDGTSPVESGGPNRCLPVILVDDLASTVAELKKRGVEFSGEISGGGEGYRIISLNDPEGNTIQLYEWT